MTHSQLATPTQNRPQTIRLLGLDFGSTTSSALVAEAKVVANCVTGHMELGDIRMIFRSEVVFTPFLNDQIDEQKIIAYIDQWLKESGLQLESFFAGGVIITGLAARQNNAHALNEIIQTRIGEVLIATADDPGLESWLAFMGSCADLSRFHADTALINLDIGGGTTNPALGINGNVQNTGCYFIGARHVQFTPGTYEILRLTPEAQQIFKELAIPKKVGDTLTTEEQQRYISFYIQWLEHIALGKAAVLANNLNHNISHRMITQCPFVIPANLPKIAITFSGGVGELVYRAALGETLPPTTFYGDFGIDLAHAILQSPILSQSLRTFIPENRGRATVYGLALHSTEVSGTTLFLPHPESLPLRNLPIVAKLSIHTSFNELKQAITHLYSHPRGACIQIIMSEYMGAIATERLEKMRDLGQNIATILTEIATTQPNYATIPFVLVIDANVGKSLGMYATKWGTLLPNLIVIDEISIRQANFINIGAPHKNVVPIAFYGMQ